MNDNWKKIIKKLYEEEKKNYNEKTLNKEKEALVKEYEKYRQKLKKGTFELDDYYNTVENGYLVHFLTQKNSSLIGNPGRYENQLMIYLIKNGENEGSYFVSEKLIGEKKDKKTVSKDEAEKYFKKIKELLEAIVDVKNIDDIKKIGNSNDTYSSFGAKGILQKLFVLESILDENKYSDMYCAIPFLYTKELINSLYERLVDGDEEGYIDRSVQLLKECYEAINEEPSFISTKILGVILYNLNHASVDVSKEQPNAILYGAPGTGKTYTIKNTMTMLDAKYELIQCHPNFDYDDFIEGIKPIGTTESGQLKFEVVNGVFKNFCIKAKNDPDNDYYFIADEINRANLSSLFGETLSLLERDYRDNPKEEIKKRKENLLRTPLSTVIEKILSEKDEKEKETYIEQNVYEYIDGKVYFGIPNNVFFIGMMNDVDKSIDAFDLALRRRFKWIRKDCDYDVVQRYLDNQGIEYDSIEYIKKCEALNKYISDGLGFGKSYVFGHSYFLKISTILGKKKEIKDEHLNKLFEEYLKPVLTEYIRSFKEETDIENELGNAGKEFGLKKNK